MGGDGSDADFQSGDAPRPRGPARRAGGGAGLVALATAALVAATPDPARAGPGGRVLLDLLNSNVSERATGALSMLGVTVVPSETASTLIFESDSGEGSEFVASQLGGAFTLSDGFPIYLEGFIGYSRYDPVFIFSDGTTISRLPTKWTTVGAEGGIGWDFKLSEHWTLRPIANVALGHVESDAALLGRYLKRRLDTPELQFLEGGRLTAGGFGGSLMLDYEYQSEPYDADLEIRYSHLVLEPIAGSKAIDASSTAATLGFWSRLRVPTGVTLFGGPLRAVGELSGSWLPGDQGDTLQTEWLAQVGLGVEFDVERTWVPLSRIRIVARQTLGSELTGYSLGLSASF